MSAEDEAPPHASTAGDGLYSAADSTAVPPMSSAAARRLATFRERRLLGKYEAAEAEYCQMMDSCRHIEDRRSAVLETKEADDFKSEEISAAMLEPVRYIVHSPDSLLTADCMFPQSSVPSAATATIETPAVVSSSAPTKRKKRRHKKKKGSKARSKKKRRSGKSKTTESSSKTCAIAQIVKSAESNGDAATIHKAAIKSTVACEPSDDFVAFDTEDTDKRSVDEMTAENMTDATLLDDCEFEADFTTDFVDFKFDTDTVDEMDKCVAKAEDFTVGSGDSIEEAVGSELSSSDTMTKSEEATIREVMSGMSLSMKSNAPKWAARISDDLLKKQMSNLL